MRLPVSEGKLAKSQRMGTPCKETAWCKGCWEMRPTVAPRDSAHCPRVCSPGLGELLPLAAGQWSALMHDETVPQADRCSLTMKPAICPHSGLLHGDRPSDCPAGACGVTATGLRGLGNPHKDTLMLPNAL